MCFPEIRGHERAKAGLRSALASGRVAPAYLFCGPEGVGRRSLMRAFAAALLCPDTGNAACGSCAACRRMRAGTHADWLELTREKETIEVESVRAFCRQAGFKPAEGSRRVGLVEEADRMTPAAANSFLKTLEEPPGGSVFLLRAEATDRLLPTIVSRCQVVRLGPLPDAAVAEELRSRNACDAETAAAVAAAAEGSIGRALALAGGERAESWRWITGELETLRPGCALAFSDGLCARASGSGAAAARSGAGLLLDLLALALRQRLRTLRGTRREIGRLESVTRAAERLAANVTPDLVLRALALELSGA